MITGDLQKEENDVMREFTAGNRLRKLSTLNRALLIAMLIVSFASLALPWRAAAQTTFSDSELKQFVAIEPIDVHTHILKSDPAFTSVLERLHLRLLNIFVGDPTSAATEQSFEMLKHDSWQAVEASGGRIRLSTTFSPFAFKEADFPQSAVKSIDQDFARGAVAVTIWSNGFTQFKDSSGKFVSADNPCLDPIYKDIAAHRKTFIAHLGGPEEAWVPDPASSAGVPVPAVLAARDRLIAQNPQLRVVGAHLGSTKEDLDRLAQRLDRYPNFAVDTSGRVPYLMGLPREQVVAFLTKYQDRILYGSDLGFRSTENMETLEKTWQERYAVEWRYFATDNTFSYRGQQVHGLDLPKPILRKLYHANAERWIPGMAR